ALTAMGHDLFAVGGNTLYHFDVTLAADPLLINEISIQGQIRDVVAKDGLLYLSSTEGVTIYKLNQFRALQQLVTVDRVALQATPHAIAVAGDSLWIALTDSRRVVEVELLSGEYRIIRDIPTVDEGGNR